MKKGLRLFYCRMALFFCIVFTQHYLYSKTDVFFAPGNSTTATLIKHINETKNNIRAAVYMFTDKNIANAVIRAKKERNVDVELVIDKISIESSYGKGLYLKENGIDLYIFDPNSDRTTRDASVTKWQSFPAIMHNKFALLDDKVWTGSFNWTRAANQQNEENVIVTTNKIVHQKYSERFEHLKKRCFDWSSSNKKTTPKADTSPKNEKDNKTIVKNKPRLKQRRRRT